MKVFVAEAICFQRVRDCLAFLVFSALSAVARITWPRGEGPVLARTKWNRNS